MNRKILITGGTGFIGSNLTEMHLDKGDVVTVVDNFSTGRNTIRHPKCEIIRADLNKQSNMSVVEKLLCDVDIVYHMAGSVGVKYVDQDPRGTLRNSLDINNNLFPLYEKFNSRVIFASTSEVYGDTTEAKETDTLKIGSPDTMRWGYACAKLMSEFLLKSYSFPNTIVRFFNVTGRGQVGDFGMVLPTFIKQARENRDVVVFGDGKQYRTFCDIRDAIVMLNILSNDEHVDEIYNIGNTNNILTISQLAETVIRVLGSNSKIVYKSHQDTFSKHFGEIYKRKPNTDKMNRYYKPKHDIESIIKSML